VACRPLTTLRRRWSEGGYPPWSFQSTHISAAPRLPDGNTFIDEGQKGQLFQVTPDGDIVWEYVNLYVCKTDQPAAGRVNANNQYYLPSAQ
jgi:hypothetical protein